MEAEYKKDEPAHMGAGYRVRGILNYGTENETYKDFTLRMYDPIKILDIRKSNASYTQKHSSGYVYDCEVNYKGKDYIVENIPQCKLCSKFGYEKHIELTKKLEQLEHIK